MTTETVMDIGDWEGRPDGIRLHQRCEADWFDSAGAPLVCDSVSQNRR
jgi:hypothetical protein